MAETQQTAQAKAEAKAGKKAQAQAKAATPKEAKKPRERSDYVPRLRTQFESVIRAELTKQLGYSNRMQVPKITKVVLNMGIGEGVADRKKVDTAANDLSLIAGQKAVITKSRKSIATYKLRDTKVAELVDFIVQRVLDHVGVDIALVRRWGGASEERSR